MPFMRPGVVSVRGLDRKPSSCSPLGGRATISLGPPLPTDSSSLPVTVQPELHGRTGHPANLPREADGPPLLDLARGGAGHARPVTRTAVRSTAPFHPYPRKVGPRLTGEALPVAVCFLWRYPSSANKLPTGGSYPPPCPAVFGLSSHSVKSGRSPRPNHAGALYAAAGAAGCRARSTEIRKPGNPKPEFKHRTLWITMLAKSPHHCHSMGPFETNWGILALGHSGFGFRVSRFRTSISPHISSPTRAW